MDGKETIEFPDVKKLTINELTKVDERTQLSEKYILPKFQRGPVWTKKANSDLIDSIKKGWPIGTIMLAKEEGKKESKDYLIIDGQQRIRAIRDYVKNPVAYLDFKDLSKKIVSLFLKTKVISPEGLIEPEKVELCVQRLLKNWVKEKQLHDLEGAKFIMLIRKQKKNILNKLNEEELMNLVAELNKEFKKYINNQEIKNYPVPAVVFNENPEYLSEIFSLLNKKGIKLNQYDIFSAQWFNFDFKIKDKKIMDLLKNRYDKWSEDVEIDGYNSKTFTTSKITLTEYLQGFGIKLNSIHRFKLLFGDNEEDPDTGFKIFSVVFKNHLQKMGDLKKDFEKYELTDEDRLQELQDKIEESVNIVCTWLERQLDFYGNKKYNKIIICHSQTQIMAFIGTVFHSKFDIYKNFEEKSTWKNNKKILEKNLPFYYLKDLIQGVWNVKHPEDEVEARINTNYYLNLLNKEKWNTAFEAYKDRTMEKVEIKENSAGRPSYHPEDRIFLNYLYNRILSERDKPYEIDHLVPYDRLVQMLRRLNIKSCALNSVANLALIRDFTNNKKKDKTIFEFEDESSFKQLKTEEKRIIENDKKNLICTKELLSLKKDSKNNDLFDNLWYEDFLNKRFDLLKEEFYRLYDIK